MTLPLALIAAVARNRVIGSDNALPWRLAGDMRHFRALTMGKPVLMGRKTWESIGRPLPGRFVLVLTRDRAYAADGVEVVHSIDQALAEAEAIGRREGSEEIIVAGGGTLYAALIDRAERLYLTEVDLAPDGDTQFPAIDPARWIESERVAHPWDERDDAAFSTVIYSRGTT